VTENDVIVALAAIWAIVTIVRAWLAYRQRTTAARLAARERRAAQ
jgi:hypothetical protein